MSNLSELPLVPSEPARPAPAEPQPAAAHRGAIALVADSALQFIDAFIPDEATAVVRRRYFEDEAANGEAGALYVVGLDDGIFHHPVTREIADASLTYTVEAASALSAFAGTWLPIPLLRVLSPDTGLGPVLDQGPTNWARVFIARAEDDGASPGWHVVVALDTTLSTTPAPKNHAGPSPTPADVAAGTRFQFSADENDVGGFVTEAWIDDWLAETYAEHFRRRQRPGDDEWVQRHALEHIASYLTLLSVLGEACALPEISFLPAGLDAPAPIPVDLVLDMGAARTNALLREASGDADPARPPIELLPLRDLSRPWVTHAGILPSRVEFARAGFGREALSRWSGRANAFYWPSLARVGAEAERLAAAQPPGADLTGLQSPARYLWDDRRAEDVWRSARGEGETAQRGAIVSGPQLANLSETGDLVTAGSPGTATTKPRFSRAALTTFAAAELILQGVTAINAPERRARHERSAAPRRLGRIVLTVPGNMHPDACHQLRLRVENAVDLVWAGLGGTTSHGRPRRPDVTFAADNATNVQSVYLLNEIVHKFHGKAREYFDLMGKTRPGGRSGRSLRVGAFDIGGATTSISIATYELSDQSRIMRSIDLVDGLPAGGDDILKAVIERHILPAIVASLGDSGLARPQRLVESLFQPAAGSRRDPATARLSARLAAHLLRPAAIALLDEHTASRTLPDDVPVHRTLGALVAQAGAASRAAADALDQLAADEGADGFSPLATEVTFLHRDLARTIGDVLAPVLQSAIRLVHALDCDVVLLAGWPSRLPVVLDTLLAGLPTRPNRIVALNDYRVSDWYPDRTGAGKVADPKSAAAVGALIEAIGALRLGARADAPDAQRLYVGRLDGTGLIPHGDVLFVQYPPGSLEAAEPQSRTMTMTTTLPVLIGARRIGLESWPATPLYQLALKDTGRREPPRFPLKVTLERTAGPAGAPDRLSVVKASDASGTTILPGELELRPQTLLDEAGCWLDTGRLDVNLAGGDQP